MRLGYIYYLGIFSNSILFLFELRESEEASRKLTPSGCNSQICEEAGF